MVSWENVDFVYPQETDHINATFLGQLPFVKCFNTTNFFFFLLLVVLSDRVHFIFTISSGSLKMLNISKLDNDQSMGTC